MFDLTATLFPDFAAPRLRPGPMAPLQQSPLYARAAQMLGARARYVSLPGAGAWVMLRTLPVLGEVALISRGLPDLSEASARALRGVARARHLVVNAEDERAAAALERAGFWQIGRARQIAELDLSASPDAMAAGLSGKWRNRLRHARADARGGALHVRRTSFPPGPRHWLFEAEARAAKTLGYRPMPPVMVSALAAARPGAAQLFVARNLEGPVGAMLFLRHGKMATYQIGWSNDAGRAASVGNLLMWRAMVELQAMGTERIDLGAADPALAPGLTRFKCGTGARVRRLGGTWMSSAALPTRRHRGSGSVLERLRAASLRDASGPAPAVSSRG